MYEVDRETFESFVENAIAGLPEDFRKRITNVDFRVEDWARGEDYGRMSLPPGSLLLGVYRGIPLTRRGSGYQMILPDTIAIFQQPLQRLASDAADLAERVAHVVRHEIAHHFGISDERLREIDAY